MSHDAVSRRNEVVVVGGGQAGLAIGYFLARQGRDFTILDAAAEPAAAWRERWESLKLFTPVRYNSLPGLPFPGDADRYPGRDEVAAYLIDYARHFELPVELNSRVRRVGKTNGTYRVELDDRTYDADQVVVTTARSRCRSYLRAPNASTPGWCSSTAVPTGRRMQSPKGRFS